MDSGGGSASVAGLRPNSSSRKRECEAGIRLTGEKHACILKSAQRNAFPNHHNLPGALEASISTTRSVEAGVPLNPHTNGLGVPDLQAVAPGSVESPAESMHKPTVCKLGLVCSSYRAKREVVPDQAVRSSFSFFFFSDSTGPWSNGI